MYENLDSGLTVSFLVVFFLVIARAFDNFQNSNKRRTALPKVLFFFRRKNDIESVVIIRDIIGK